jgi:hypothetical protein
MTAAVLYGEAGAGERKQLAEVQPLAVEFEQHPENETVQQGLQLMRGAHDNTVPVRRNDSGSEEGQNMIITMDRVIGKAQYTDLFVDRSAERMVHSGEAHLRLVADIGMDGLDCTARFVDIAAHNAQGELAGMVAYFSADCTAVGLDPTHRLYNTHLTHFTYHDGHAVVANSTVQENMPPFLHTLAEEWFKPSDPTTMRDQEVVQNTMRELSEVLFMRATYQAMSGDHADAMRLLDADVDRCIRRLENQGLELKAGKKKNLE